MLSLTLGCFVAIPNPENKRMLVPAKVLEIQADKCSLQLEEAIPPDAGDEFTIFAEWRGKFHQQGALRLATQVDAPIVQFQRIGEPVNCESRGCYRVSVVSQGIKVAVGKRSRCLLADISAEGISVIVSEPLKVGTTVAVDLCEDDIRALGTLRVQSEKNLPDGRLRYGLYAAEKRTALRKALESLSGMMQRRQLRRLAGAA